MPTAHQRAVCQRRRQPAVELPRPRREHAGQQEQHGQLEQDEPERAVRPQSQPQVHHRQLRHRQREHDGVGHDADVKVHGEDFDVQKRGIYEEQGLEEQQHQPVAHDTAAGQQVEAQAEQDRLVDVERDDQRQQAAQADARPGQAVGQRQAAGQHAHGAEQVEGVVADEEADRGGTGGGILGCVFQGGHGVLPTRLFDVIQKTERRAPPSNETGGPAEDPPARRF
jgi:hypothetical protein